MSLLDFFRAPLNTETGSKRRASEGEKGFNKRFKAAVNLSDDTDSNASSSEASDDDEGPVASTSSYKATSGFTITRNAALGVKTRNIQSRLSTRPILQSMVSSHHSDTYKFQSIADDNSLTPPYACHYSHGARRGDGVPLLAVATEQGTIHVINTVKRDDWDYEPPREIFQVHENGVFEVEFSPDDTRIATASGDHSSVVLDAKTGDVVHKLIGHGSTVKAVSWDPSHRDLISTGGRDGRLCVWDVRVSGEHPALTIAGAHGTDLEPGKTSKKDTSARTVTSILYPAGFPNGIVTSGSFDGILRFWDLRSPSKGRNPAAILKSCQKEHLKPQNAYASMFDPTTLGGTRRPRGLMTMTAGSGPTARLLFALSLDSRVHTYSLSGVEDDDNTVIPGSNMLLSLRPDHEPAPTPKKPTKRAQAVPLTSKIREAGTPTLTPLGKTYESPLLVVANYYIRAVTSPCGRWLATGCSGTAGHVFLFDVSRASSPLEPTPAPVVLGGHYGEVGALDWSKDSLATCSEEGIVRIWRPNVDAWGMRASDEFNNNWVGTVA